jgi:uncharacterized membrane protein
MKRFNCLFERVSNIGVGSALLLIALGFVVITVTILPPFGLLVAVPVMGLATLFFFARRSRECRLS